MEEHNKQHETNLHNLQFHINGEKYSVNKIVFSKLLALGLVCYLIVLPIWARRSPGMKELVNRIGIPLPTKVQIVVWILAMGLPEAIVLTKKKGEVREACAGLILFVTLLRPSNRKIYFPDGDGNG